MPLIRGRHYADHYDSIFIGTSTLSLLEAIYQRRQGRQVLMIDDQPRIGGVWVALELFGLHDVENAIHYFLFDRLGIEFMRSALGWNVVASPRKYRIFHEPFFGLRRIAYDNRLGLVAARLVEARSDTPAGERGPGWRLRVLASAVREALGRRGGSHYLAGGTPEMMRSIESLVSGTQLELLMSTHVERLHFDRAARRVTVGAGGAEFTADSIGISHGSRLKNLSCDSGTVEVPQETHRRPQIHMLVRDSSPALIYEGIFVADPLIKYVHDVTRFTREAAEIQGKNKLLVLATQHEYVESEALYRQLLDRLKSAGVVGDDAQLEGYNWYESFLPALSTDVLGDLQRRFAPLVNILKSEDFCAAMGLYGPRWRTALC